MQKGSNAGKCRRRAWGQDGTRGETVLMMDVMLLEMQMDGCGGWRSSSAGWS